jgi:hypothetical protein
VGQKAAGADLRRLLGFGRRLPRENWMLLGATVAHPRAWNPVEKPFREAIPFLLWSAPKELLSQIARIGSDFEQPNDSIVLTSQAPCGLLHLFANDWWQTSANNSGGPRLRITRVDAPVAGKPLWSLQHSFRIGKDGKQEEVNVWERTIMAG